MICKYIAVVDYKILIDYDYLVLFMLFKYWIFMVFFSIWKNKKLLITLYK